MDDILWNDMLDRQARYALWSPLLERQRWLERHARWSGQDGRARFALSASGPMLFALAQRPYDADADHRLQALDDVRYEQLVTARVRPVLAAFTPRPNAITLLRDGQLAWLVLHPAAGHPAWQAAADPGGCSATQLAAALTLVESFNAFGRKGARVLIDSVRSQIGRAEASASPPPSSSARPKLWV